MPEIVDRIHDALMEDPDFKPYPGETKDAAAWKISWSKYKQMQKNNVALEFLPDEKKTINFDEMLDNPTDDGGKQKVSAYDKFGNFLQKSFGVEIEKQATVGMPPRPGLQWRTATHRWIRPKEAFGWPVPATKLIDTLSGVSDTSELQMDVARSLREYLPQIASPSVKKRLISAYLALKNNPSDRKNRQRMLEAVHASVGVKKADIEKGYRNGG